MEENEEGERRREEERWSIKEKEEGRINRERDVLNLRTKYEVEKTQREEGHSKEQEEVKERSEEVGEEEVKEDAETKPVIDYLQNLYSKTVKSVHLQKTRRSRRNEEIVNLTVVKESLDFLYHEALKKTSSNLLSRQSPDKSNKSNQISTKSSQISTQTSQNSNDQTSTKEGYISSQTSQNSNDQTFNRSSLSSSRMGHNSNETGQRQSLNEGIQIWVKTDETRDIDFYLNAERMMNPIEEIGRKSLDSLENLLFAGWLMNVKREGND